MTIRPLRYLGDPVLSTRAATVTDFDAALSRLIGDLLDTVALRGRAGLAAPQIGVGLAVIAFDLGSHHGYLVNPVVARTEGTAVGWEGCLSLPRAEAITPRPNVVVVTGVDARGRPVTVTGRGEFARCLLHETDHLAGTLYVDRLDPRMRKRVLAEVQVP